MKTDKGIFFVVSGPSGVGKGTVLEEVFKIVDGLNFSVSATTREIRDGEEHGKNYFYVSDEEFDEMIEKGEMLEYVELYNARYGTSRIFVEKLFGNGGDVVLEINTDGAANVKRLYPECVTVFILPPSWRELKKRLKKRKSESCKQRRIRIAHSKYEMTLAPQYDYSVVNKKVEDCAKEIAKIIETERKKRENN